MVDLNNEKLHLDYPCHWVYKVIGSGQEQMRDAIEEVVHDYEHTVTFSNASRTGKYCCLNLEMTVYSDETRTGIYTALKQHPNIMLVL